MKSYKKQVFTLAVTGVSTLSILGMPFAAFAQPAMSHMNTAGPTTHSSASHYSANLDQLNNSGVSGDATLKFKQGTTAGSEQLKVKLQAHGTTPDKTHAVHIHGKDHPEVAFCPTPAVDANNDGFISVVEGAATYGPIKLNLTSPQTPFGASPTPALFTPFAGTPDSSKFPKANADGTIKLNQTYAFDTSSDARAALQSITPLENQHIVVHGANAPASVDADAFAILGAPVTGPMDVVIYDALLPVACGEINKVSTENDTPVVTPPVVTPPVVTPPVVTSPSTTAQSDFQARIAVLQQQYTTADQAALAQFNTMQDDGKTTEARDQYIAATQSARDHYVNQFYEARNQFVDRLNQTGNIALRDSVATQAEHELANFTATFEASKRAFIERTDNQ